MAPSYRESGAVSTSGRHVLLARDMSANRRLQASSGVVFRKKVRTGPKSALYRRATAC